MDFLNNCISLKTRDMKKIFFAAFLISLSGIVTAQTSKKDTTAKPAPPTVTVTRFTPPVIVKDSQSKVSKGAKKQAGRIPPPPPPAIMKNSAKKN